MKYYFPPKNQTVSFLQTNRSDDLGSLWSTFNLDFQSNLGVIRLAPKLVTNTTSATVATLGCPAAFEYFEDMWFAICDTRILRTTSESITAAFSVDTSLYTVGDSTSQFDITNTSGTTYRYTFDGTGTSPGITTSTFPTGATVTIAAQNFTAGNNGTFLVTGSGSNYFEVTNASGVVESNKTLGTGYLAVYGGTVGTNYSVDQSDFEIFNSRLWSTTSNKLYSRALGGAGLWTIRDTLGSTGSHKLSYFTKYNRLYFIDDNTTISSIGTNDVVANSAGDYFIDLTTNIGIATTMTSNSQSIWIGSLKVDDNSSGYGVVGSILQWDGFSSQITQEYKLQTAGCLAMVIYNDVPYAIDTEGRILKYTGYSFEEFARLPINRTLLTQATKSTNIGGRFVHFNGMIATKNNTLLININNLNGDNTGNITENLPSGIWELDLNTRNFTHRSAFTYSANGSSTITDYGQNRIAIAGAIKLNPLSSAATTGRGTILAGAKYYTDATSTKSAIFIDSPVNPTTNYEGQKRGYYVTTWFNSSEVEDKFERLWDVHKRFLTSTDKIVYKYRLIEEDPIQATITWTSTTTFTTTTDVSAYGPTATGFNGTSGGEVEVVQGTGSGSCTHISDISESGGTYTVTLDTAVTGVTGTAKARFQKWIKLFPEVTGQIKSWEQMAILSNNTQIQIKCCMEFTGDMEFHRFAIFSNEDIKITA